MHTHSTASDGSRTPREVVRAAHDLGLVAIALTDHDTVDGLGDAYDEGRSLGVRVIAGIELSAVESNAETHLLGLHLTEVDRLAARLRDLRTMRLTRAERIVKRLNELGVKVTIEEVLEQAAGGAVGRPHIARALVNDGWATDVRDAFDRYLGNGRPAFVAKDRLSMSDAIAMIHDAGGLAVLAHPGSAGTRARIEALAGIGLDGVEVKHPSHSAEDAARMLALVDHFRLVPSGGSDWHGLSDGGRALGGMRVPLAWIGRQEQAVATRARPRNGDHQAFVA
ncbi:MAG: PHP domain-containing protein [Gemmatimonadaceae bacterium]